MKKNGTNNCTAKIVGFHLCLVLAVGLIAYSNILDGPFVFDDISSIRDNPAIRELSTFADVEALSKRARHTDEAVQHVVRTRYISYLSFALNYRMHGLSTFGYHLVNLLIHLCNGLLVYLIGSQLWRLVKGGKRDNQTSVHGCWAALVAALLFISHPIQTQAVSYIVQRMTSLATLFLLLAMAFYLGALLKDQHRKRWLLLGACLIFGMLGALSKEFVLLLPVFLLCFELLNKRSLWAKKMWRLLLILPVSLLPPFMLFGFKTAGSEKLTETLSSVTSGPSIGPLEYFYTQMLVVPQYLHLLVWPVGQNVDHDVPLASSFFDTGVWSGTLLLVVLLIVLGWVTMRSFQDIRLRLIAVTGWAFWVALLPESSFFPIADVMFEHRMYFPMVWLSLSIGFLVLHGAIVMKPVHKKKLCFVVCLVIVLLTGITWERNWVWTDREDFWQDVISKSPLKARPYHNLAKELEQQERFEEALHLYAKAAKLKPMDSRIHFSYARNLQKTGRFSDAVEEYQKALSLDPNMHKAHFNLAVLALDMDNLFVAEKSFATFLQMVRGEDNDSSQRFAAHYSLANLLRDAQRHTEANLHYQKALQLEPGSVDLNNDYGIYLADMGSYREAEFFLRRAAESPECSSKSNNNLGALFMVLGRLDEARLAFAQALSCNSGDQQALSNLNRLNSK